MSWLMSNPFSLICSYKKGCQRTSHKQYPPPPPADCKFMAARVVWHIYYQNLAGVIETALEHLSASNSPELIPQIADAAQQLNLNLDNMVEKPCWEISLKNTWHSSVEVKMGAMACIPASSVCLLLFLDCYIYVFWL